MASKYNDPVAVIQVIGCVFNDVGLLDQDDTYVFADEDFHNEFHRIVFGAIYQLHDSGASSVSVQGISNFLALRPKQFAVFEVNKGPEFLLRASSTANPMAFKYYYDRMKKMTLLRAYDNFGLDMSFLYDPDNILDIKKKEVQEAWLDNASLQEIADTIDERITAIRQEYADVNDCSQSFEAGDGIFELIERFEQVPDVGVPLYGNYINTITRGARLGKFYLRSAPTGVGKTRSMIADACNIACGRIYDADLGWITLGKQFPTLFIGTEQDKDEIQTMMLSFLSNVNEEHILNGHYEGDERKRVFEAARLIKEAPLYIEVLPEFNMQDVENVIKRKIREKNVQYIFHDYIHTSIKILEEISRRAGKVALREDNILFMLSARLKDICVKYNVFIMSATQLNGDYKDAKTPDQNLLRGAKAIADKIDYGSILLPVTDVDLASLENVLSKNPNFGTPTIKLSIYKNRRGKYKGVILWCTADLGTCRIQPVFLTNFVYEMQPIENIKVKFEDESAF